MNHRELRLWQSARTMADLCDLTARWLSRDIRSHPACGKPHRETQRITGPLIALNRGGFLTTGSQPGEIVIGRRGERWEQRAAVVGFASTATLAALREALPAGVQISAYPAGPDEGPEVDLSTRVEVSRQDGQVWTWFGARLSAAMIRESVESPVASCGREAVDEVCRAWQVSIVDLEWGRGTMWDVLAGAVARS